MILRIKGSIPIKLFKFVLSVLWKTLLEEDMSKDMKKYAPFSLYTKKLTIIKIDYLEIMQLLACLEEEI